MLIRIKFILCINCLWGLGRTTENSVVSAEAEGATHRPQDPQRGARKGRQISSEFPGLILGLFHNDPSMLRNHCAIVYKAYCDLPERQKN